MIMNACLVCHETSQNHEISNIFEEKFASFRHTLEKIVKRRILCEKFQEQQICSQCCVAVQEYEVLEEKLLQICEKLGEKFQQIHPSKRGRKRKIEISEESDTKIEVGTSIRFVIQQNCPNIPKPKASTDF